MIVKVIPQRKEPEIKAQPWEIERTEFDEVETTQNEICLTISPEFVQNETPGMSM